MRRIVNSEHPENPSPSSRGALEDWWVRVEVADAPSSPAAASSCSDMEGSSDINFFKTAL